MPARRLIDIPSIYVDRLRSNGWSLADLRILSDVLYAFRWLAKNKKRGGLQLEQATWTTQFGINDNCAFFTIRNMHLSYRFCNSAKSRVLYALRWLCKWGIIVSYNKHDPLVFLQRTTNRPAQIVFVSIAFSKLELNDVLSLQEHWLDYWSLNSDIDSLSKIITWIPLVASIEPV